MKIPTGVLGALALTLSLVTCGQKAPEGRWVVWGSNRSGGPHDLYLARANGSQLRRLTTSGGSHPSWSPDGRWIAYTALPSKAARVVRWDGSDDHQLCKGSPVFWLRDGRGLVCRDEDRYTVVDVDGGKSTPLFTKDDFPVLEDKELNPSDMSVDGRFLVGHTNRYRRRFKGSNGTFRAYHAAVLLDFEHPEQIFFIGNGCQPAFSPVDDWIYHVCGGRECPAEPDIMRLRTSDRKGRVAYDPVIALPDNEWGHTYQPRLSNDGKWLTYAATTDGCHNQDTCNYELFLLRLDNPAAMPRRLTHDPGNDQWPHLWVGSPERPD